MPKAIRKSTGKATDKRTGATSTSKDKKRPIAKKVIAKKAAKPAISAKAVKAKKTAPVRNSAKCLDLFLILDCTASMHSWIQRSKDTLKQIIDHVKATNKGLSVEVAFVAYRDIGDSGRHVVADFTSDIESVKSLI